MPSTSSKLAGANLVDESVHAPGPPATLWDNCAYSIKRHGISFTNCDAEAVQTPGCIQAHGALLVLRLPDLTILQISENTLELLGIRPDALLGRSVPVVIQPAGVERLLHLIQTQPGDVEYCYTNGANAYHLKPVSLPAHLQVLANIFRYWLVCAALPEIECPAR
jgi:hypothetical protein